MIRLPSHFSLCLLALVICSPATRGEEVGIAFFEKKIRPVLVEHCFKCHSSESKSPRGGLRVDSRDALRKGGDSGPGIVPGKPDQSLLVKAIRYHDESLRMPPRAKLPATVIADFETWITHGAPDPRTDKLPPLGAIDWPSARKHWAFQPVRRPIPPVVKHPSWPRTPLDRFLLARLEARGITPSPVADRRTLIRRLSVDLIGLLPTPDEVESFVADRSPNAYEKLVDRLLASPAYGERWGRHWLDVARYADTKDGVLMYGDDRVRPYAYTYRDYVIRAFNEDLPFDRFVHEQLAADRLEPTLERWRLGAMGFLTLGRMFDNNIHDILDDRIDTVTRGLLGLTVSCARCHDHKYDPIPLTDYYSLYGVFANSEAPLELPLIGSPTHSDFEKKISTKRVELKTFLDTQYSMLLESSRHRVGDYLVHVVTTKPDPLETAIFFLSLAPTDLRPQMVARWRTFLAQRAVADDPVFGPWHDLMQVAEPQLSAQLPSLQTRWRARTAGIERGQLNPLVLEALVKAKITRHVDMARVYGDLLRSTYDAAKKSLPTSRAGEQLLVLVISPESPAYFPKSRTRDYMSRGEKDAFGGKLQELDRMAVQSPLAPARAMILVDSEQTYEPRVFVRGDPSRPGERVPRQFLRIVAGEKRQPFAGDSGRLDLARAITAPANPLTSRVLVNRMWMHHFGEPLVETPSDFGLRTSAPVQQELLDYLASEMVKNGWSMKHLHRLLVLSSAYQQASLDRPDCRKVDPDNHLFWRMNRRRLELEVMRDSMLTIAGRLDTTMFGRPVPVASDPKNARRTVYGLVDRQSLPGLFRAFDFASPDASAERRPRTTVPQQALFGMNAPFMLEQARALAARPEIVATTDAKERIERMVRLVLCRKPAEAEVRLFLDFVQSARMPGESSRLDRWQQLAQVLLLTNELMFVD